MSPEQQQLQIQNEERQLEILQQRQNLRQQLICPGTSGQRRSWPISIELPDMERQEKMEGIGRKERIEGMGRQKKIEGMDRQGKIS